MIDREYFTNWALRHSFDFSFLPELVTATGSLAVGASLGPSVETRRLRAQAGMWRQGHPNSPEASADG